MDKISVRLNEQAEYDFKVVKDYLFEISNASLLDIDVSNSNVIKQALHMAAVIIENEWFEKIESNKTDT